MRDRVAPLQMNINQQTQILLEKARRDEAALVEYLRDKRVIIVGPGGSLKGRRLGPMIDSFDVVVRLNRDLQTRGRALDYGTRVDIAYNNMTQSERNKQLRESLGKLGIKFVISPYPLVTPFEKDIILSLRANRGRLPYVIPPNSLYMRMMGGLEWTRPFTGLCAILDMLRFPIKSLDVFGVDFYLSQSYHANYKNDKSVAQIAENSIHSASKHHRFLQRFIFTEPRLTYDPEVVKILFQREHKWALWLRAHNEAIYPKLREWYTNHVAGVQCISCFDSISEYLGAPATDADTDAEHLYMIFHDITDTNAKSIEDIPESSRERVWIWSEFPGLEYERVIDPLNYLEFNLADDLKTQGGKALATEFSNFDTMISGLFAHAPDAVKLKIGQMHFARSGWLGYLKSIGVFC